MKVNELLADGLFTPLNVSDGEREIDGAYVGDLLSWVMGRAQSGNAWLTIMTNLNVVAVASLADVSCVILTEGVQPDKQMLDAAALRQINLISTSLPTYEAAVKLSATI